MLQGIEVPRDEPTSEQRAAGATAFLRYACKMATGTGKTTVMGMLAAWSILNKVANRGDARFSDVVLVVCPNVTIRDRLAELDLELGEASSIARATSCRRHLMPRLRAGTRARHELARVRAATQSVGDVSARVLKVGQRVTCTERDPHRRRRRPRRAAAAT